MARLACGLALLAAHAAAARPVAGLLGRLPACAGALQTADRLLIVLGTVPIALPGNVRGPAQCTCALLCSL